MTKLETWVEPTIVPGKELAQPATLSTDQAQAWLEGLQEQRGLERAWGLLGMIGYLRSGRTSAPAQAELKDQVQGMLGEYQSLSAEWARQWPEALRELSPGVQRDFQTMARLGPTVRGLAVTDPAAALCAAAGVVLSFFLKGWPQLIVILLGLGLAWMLAGARVRSADRAARRQEGSFTGGLRFWSPLASRSLAECRALEQPAAVVLSPTTAVTANGDIPES